MAEIIPGPPLKDITITYGADLVYPVSRTASGVPAPFDNYLRAFIRLGDKDSAGEYDCEIVDGRIIMRIESEVLDEISRSINYVLLTSEPTDPNSTEIAYMAGKLFRTKR